VQLVKIFFCQAKVYRHTIFEGALAEFGGFLLEFFDGTLIDATALVDQVPSGSRFAGIDVANDCDEKDFKVGDRVDRKIDKDTDRQR
jgi:hypothetical protein